MEFEQMLHVFENYTILISDLFILFIYLVSKHVRHFPCMSGTLFSVPNKVASTPSGQCLMSALNICLISDAVLQIQMLCIIFLSSMSSSPSGCLGEDFIIFGPIAQKVKPGDKISGSQSQIASKKFHGLGKFTFCSLSH